MIARSHARKLLAAALATAVLALAASPVTAGDACPEPLPLACGAVVTGALDADDCPLRVNGRADGTRFDRFALALEGPRRFTVTLRSEAFDAFLYLLGPQDGEVAFDDDGVGDDDGARDDDGAGGRDARLEFTAPDSSPYAVLVNHFFFSGAGAYTLELTCDAIVRDVLFADGFEAGPVPPGD